MASTLTIENQTTACAKLYKLVRDFVANTPNWATAIRYQTLPDERFDLTLISQRVYGNRDEFLTISAAAGLESIENMLSEQLLTLPTPDQLAAMKVQAGFVNDDYTRQLA
jgi:hypothetical protein